MSTEVIREAITCEGLSLNVDREASMIRGVKVLGLKSKNGREYLPEAIRGAVSLYEGAKVNIDHGADPRQRRSYGERLGRLVGVREQADGLYADLHFNPKHALAEQLLWDAENAPGNLGLSHNAEGRIVRRGSKSVIEQIFSVRSVDLVADPASTAGLFESEGGAAAEHHKREPKHEDSEMELKELTLDGLRTARPDLIESITEAVTSQIRGSEEQKAKDEKLKALQEELDGLKAAEAARQRDQSITEAIKAAGLDPENKTVCSDLFRQSLREAKDDAAMKQLIEDRKALVGLAESNGNHRPTSQFAGGGAAGNFPSGKAFVGSLRE